MSKTKVVDGIRYHVDRPDSCRACYFYKNKAIGCILGKENCYYLAEVVMTEQEKNSPSYGTNYQKLGKDMPYLFVKSSVALNLS